MARNGTNNKGARKKKRSLIKELERVRTPLMVILGGLLGATTVVEILDQVRGDLALILSFTLLGIIGLLGWGRQPVLRDSAKRTQESSRPQQQK